MAVPNTLGPRALISFRPLGGSEIDITTTAQNFKISNGGAPVEFATMAGNQVREILKPREPVEISFDWKPTGLYSGTKDLTALFYNSTETTASGVTTILPSIHPSQRVNGRITILFTDKTTVLSAEEAVASDSTYYATRFAFANLRITNAGQFDFAPENGVTQSITMTCAPVDAAGDANIVEEHLAVGTGTLSAMSGYASNADFVAKFHA